MNLKGLKGVLHGDAVQELFEIAKKHQFSPSVGLGLGGAEEIEIKATDIENIEGEDVK